MATPRLAKRVKRSVVAEAEAYGQRWSDHAPVTRVFDWDVASVATPKALWPHGPTHHSAASV